MNIWYARRIRYDLNYDEEFKTGKSRSLGVLRKTFTCFVLSLP